MEEGGSTEWKIARGRRKREIWTSGDVGVERSEAIRMRFEFWVHLRICMCKHRCIPRQRYDLRVRAIIPSIQPVSRLFDETIPPESSLLNEKKKKKRTDFPRCHTPLSHKTCNSRFRVWRTTRLFNLLPFVASTNFPRVLLLRELVSLYAPWFR